MKTMFSRLLPYAFILTTGLHVSDAMAAPLAAPSAAGFVVTLAKAVDAPSSAILDGAMWRCVGDSCKAVDEYQRPQFI